MIIENIDREQDYYDLYESLGYDVIGIASHNEVLKSRNFNSD